MPIDPQAKAIGDLMGSTIDVTRMDLPTVRATIDEQARAAEKPPIARVEDRSVPGPGGELPVRVYTPEREGPRAGLVYFHGGGWTFCSIETHDVTCRQLADAVGCTVVSVDYRLAPEHRYPAAAEDAYAATCWAAERAGELGIDPRRLGVAGDSAGGNLAAVVALMARDRGGPALRHQLLLYPITDCDLDTASYRENAQGPLLTRAMMEAFWDNYVDDEARRAEPYVSPLRAESHGDLPPAFVVTAEYDPLRDEGEAYAERMRAAGVPVESRRYEGMIHGFFVLDAVLDGARAAQADAVAQLRLHLGV